MISEFLFYDDNAPKDEKSNYVNLKIEIRELLKDDLNRRLLSEILLDLGKDVSGDTQIRLFKLYQDLGLHNDAFKKLKSWRWEVVSKGILELTQMQVAESYGFIVKFINDRRGTIRKQAEIATVTLKHEGISHFLDTTKYKISEWQQLKLLDVIRNLDDFNPPRFKVWLTSTNRHVVLFALRLIKYYQQNDANTTLIELVKHKNNQIKEEAIACIKEFNVVEALDMLKLVFWKSTIDLKIAILDTIAAIGNDSDIEFLQLIENKESNFSVKSKALGSINTISPELILPSKGIVDTTGYKVPDDMVTEKDSLNAEVARNHMQVHQDAKQQQEPEISDVATLTNIDLMAKTQEKQPEDNEHESALNTIDRSDKIEAGSINLDFLPIVIGANENKYRPDKTKRLSNPNMLVVDFEEVLNKPAIGKNIPFDINANTHSVDFDNKGIGFLPIVVDNLAETIADTTLKDELKMPDTINNGEIGQIEVQFEEITITGIKEETHRNALEELDSSFVHSPEFELDLEPENTPISNIDYEFYNTPEIFEINIDFEEVLVAQDEKSLNIYDIEVISPYYVSYDNMNSIENAIDVEFNKDCKIPQIQDEMTPEAEQKLKAIINDLIDLESKEQLDQIIEEFEDWPNTELYEEVIDLNFIPLVNDKEAPQEVKAKNNVDQSNTKTPVDKSDTIIEHDSNDKIEFDISQTSIPNPLLPKEDGEESLMRLLDGIAELGDHREIPLLNELLANEKNGATKNRILSLLEKFSEESSHITKGEELRPFNVFEDLFRTCDTEAKLILLEEVIAVGDEKDLVFLEGLLDDQEPKIRLKATLVLEELRIKLDVKKGDLDNSLMKDKNDLTKGKPSKKETPVEYTTLMEELQIEPSSDQSGMFYIEFELTEDLEKDNGDELNVKKETTSEKEVSNSFFGQLCLIPSKLIEKLNG